PLPRSGTRFASGLNDMCRESELLVPAPSGPIQPGVKGAGRKTKARTKNPKICLSVQTREWDHRVIGITSERRRAMFFRDRADAARQLAARLKGRPLRDPVVLAVPRGGVVTGAVLAQELGAELDIVLARKLRSPNYPEFALGAVSETGEVYLNEHLGAADVIGLEDYLTIERRTQIEEIARRNRQLREIRPPL